MSFYLIRRNKVVIIRTIIVFFTTAAIFILLSRTTKKSPKSSRKSSSFLSSLLLANSEEELFETHPKHSNQSEPELSAEDWYLFNQLNPVVKGWGEKGEAVILKSKEDMDESKKLFKSGYFDVYISNRISPSRSLPDVRSYECSKVHYDLDSLGTASIVIIYYNEIWSALIRTVWSVWNRTPDVLLKEIILVDDFSDKPELSTPLDKYMSYYFGDRVRIFRLDKKKGVVGARLKGAREAKGDAIIFLDSHCEVTKGWAQPLLKRIRDDRRNVITPIIDSLIEQTMAYSVVPVLDIGGFSWSGDFIWILINEDVLKKNPTTVIESPTMAGGLFAIDREYFFEMGSYDEAMEGWGGENLEISFRIWQCGGRIEIHPCSHVGHIFREFQPYTSPINDEQYINILRTVLVWMDPDHLKYFFMENSNLKEKSPGDLSSRLALKRRLNCKSFKWYLDNVYMGKKYMFDVDAKAYGFVSNLITNLCLDNLDRDEHNPYTLGVSECEYDKPLDSWTYQVFTLTNSGELRREECCATAHPHNNTVEMKQCFHTIKAQGEMRNQLWTHPKGGKIINKMTGQCLSTSGAHTGSLDVTIVDCKEGDVNQLWWFQTYTNNSKQDIPIREPIKII